MTSKQGLVFQISDREAVIADLKLERDTALAALAARTQQRDALREALAEMLEVFEGYEMLAALPIDVREKAQAALALVRDA